MKDYLNTPLHERINFKARFFEGDAMRSTLNHIIYNFSDVVRARKMHEIKTVLLAINGGNEDHILRVVKMEAKWS